MNIKFDIKKVEWNGTCFKGQIDEVNATEIMALLNASGINSIINGRDIYKYDNGVFSFYNHSKVSFYEDFFLQHKDTSFKKMLQKLEKKDFTATIETLLFLESKQDFISIPAIDEAALNLYTTVLKGNNIVNELDIKRSQLEIPPTYFFTLLEHLEEENISAITKKSLIYYSELFSLFFLANKTTFNDGKFDFEIIGVNGDKTKKTIQWQQWDQLCDYKYTKIFSWVLKNCDKALKKDTLIKIVRQFFLEKKNFEWESDYLYSLDSLLRIVVQQETQKYFEQQNKLKDEFIAYSKMEIDSKKQLLKSLLTLITTLSLGYYGLIFKVENFDIFSPNKPLKILFIFALIAIIYFSVIFYLDYEERKIFWKKLKNIYVQKFYFSEMDFKNMLPKPELLKGQKHYIIILIIFITLVCSMIKIYS